VEAIKPHAAATARPGADSDLGGFGGLFDLKAAGFVDPLLVAGTDGVGTKVKLAIETGRHDTIGIDLVAMCVNDIVVQGAEPLFFLDYFATSKLSALLADAVVSGIAAGCREAGCALIGGETAEMPGLYQSGDYDLAGFAVGAVERANLLDGRAVCEGDTVLGLGSNGPHSNGYSLIRAIVQKNETALSSPAPFDPDRSLSQALLEPTRIYVRACLAARDAGGVHAFAHITGGGLMENLPRVLPDASLAIELDRTAWPRPAVFEWIAQAGDVDAHEMHRTFNCGIGMTILVAPDRVDAVVETLAELGETVFTIGSVVRRAANVPVTIKGL